MRLRIAFSKKQMLGVLLAFSAIACLTGRRTARPLRQATSFFLAPLGDAPMYAITKLTAGAPGGNPGRLSAAEARKLRRENDYLR
jgi:hypothetical protein